MKDDMISRQAAIETVKKHYRVDNDLLEVIAYEIEALPSTQPGWIPCSERCPDKSEWYLVTEEWDDGLTVVTRDRYVVGEGWAYAVFGTKCLAWMPLPTPYREGEQDEF